jgi:hypothetical protein
MHHHQAVSVRHLQSSARRIRTGVGFETYGRWRIVDQPFPESFVDLSAILLQAIHQGVRQNILRLAISTDYD